MVYVQCPCACPFGDGDGDGMDSRSTSSGGSRRPKRSMPTKATYLHLQWQWRWNRGNSCSTISNVPMFQCSNVPMYVKETEAHIRPFGISCSHKSKCCLGESAESVESRGQGRLVMPNTYCSQTWPTRTYSNLCWSSWASAAAPPPTPSPQRRPLFRVDCNLHQMSRRSTSL